MVTSIAWLYDRVLRSPIESTTQSGHSDGAIKLSFSDSLGRAKQRQDCPLEGSQG